MIDADLILLAIVAVDLYVVSTGRLLARNTACAVQGILLALLPLAAASASLGEDGLAIEIGIASVATLVLKAIVVPHFLRRALLQTGVSREVEPFVSLHLSLLVAAGLVGLSFWLWPALVPPRAHTSPFGVPAGMSTLLIGLYLTVTGRTKVTQVLGYLVAENGVFVIGQVVLGEFPLVVELGVLLDVLVAVLLMGVLFAFDARDVDSFDDPEESAATGVAGGPQ